MSSEARAVRDQLQSALASVLAGQGDFITRWVAVVEVIGPDGKRAAWTLRQKGSMPWDVAGLLDYALAIEHGAIFKDE